MGIMRLEADDEFLGMSRDEIVMGLEAIHEPVYMPESTEHLREPEEYKVKQGIPLTFRPQLKNLQ